MKVLEQPMQPSREEIDRAFLAGYRTIDEGRSFYDGFEAYLRSIGCQKRDDMPCTCPDRGAHGHMPECRWFKA